MILVALVGLWGLVLIVLTAFLLAMSTVGQEFSVTALGTGIAVGIGAIITLLPVLAWLRDHGAKRLWPTVAPDLVSRHGSTPTGGVFPAARVREGWPAVRLGPWNA